MGREKKKKKGSRDPRVWGCGGAVPGGVLCGHPLPSPSHPALVRGCIPAAKYAGGGGGGEKTIKKKISPLKGPGLNSAFLEK